MSTLLKIVGLAIGFMSAALAQTHAPVGLQLYSFRNQFSRDVPGTMVKVREMGFREVEVAGTYGLSTADFRKLLDDNGIKAVSLGASFEELETGIPRVIENARTLGAKYVTCAWIPHATDRLTIAEADRAIDAFNTAGKLLRDNGLAFCYHIHGYEFQPYQDGTFFDYFIQNVNPKYVDFEMDVFWVKQAGLDPVAFLQKYGRRIPLLHLKDRRPGTPGSDTGHGDVESNVTLGQGDIGIAQIMKQAHKSGVKHLFIEDESSRSMQQVPESVSYLRSLK